MRNIIEKRRKTPIIEETGVLVCGGGTAGVVAALAAAREGVKTLLVEQFGSLGGTATLAQTTPMMRNEIDGNDLIRGIHAEIQEMLVKMGSGKTAKEAMYFDPVLLRIILDRLCIKYGVKLLLNTYIVGAIVEKKALKGVLVENKSGRSAILAKVTIDATGDADVAAFAGVPFETGESKKHINQPMNLRFSMAKVDIKKALRFFKELGFTGGTISISASEATETKLAPLIRKVVKEGILRKGDLGCFQFFIMRGRPGEVSFNGPRLTGFRATDGWSITEAQIIGRQKILRIVQFLRKYCQGFEKAYIAEIAPMLGIRESRRIVGKYKLTVDDVLKGKKFPDAVTRNCYPVDIHSPTGRGTTIIHLSPGEFHEIPYRSLLPKKIDRLLVAGRCLSATFEAQSAVRIQMNCRAMGEAAGLAAAICVKEGKMPSAIDGIRLRDLLVRKGLFSS